MSGLQNLSLEQAAVLIASRVRVKQAGLFNKAIPDADITETMVHEPGGKHFWGGVEQYAEPRLLPRLIGGDANARFNSTADLVNKHYDQVITPEHVDALRQNMGDPELGHPDFRAALLVKYLAHRHPGIFRMRPEGLSNTPVEDMAKHLVPPAVKQAVESTTKPEYSQNIQQSPTQPDAPRNATSPAQGEPGIMDRVRAALGNIDFGALANRGIDAAKGFSPGSNPLHTALLGGGLGMGVGALGSLTSSDKEKRKRWLRNALFGGAMGGIGGAGLGAAMNYGNKLVTEQSAREQAELNRPQEPTLADRFSHVASGLGISGTPAEATGTATSPATLVGGGAIGGNLIDRALSRRAVNSAKHTALQESLHNNAFKPFIDKANAGLTVAGQPPVTPEQQAAFINPPAKPGVMSQLQQRVNDSASSVKNTAKDFLTRTYPINRRPQQATTTPTQQRQPTPGLAMSPPQLKALHAANAAYMSPEAKKAIPRQRGGLYGTMLGAGLGAAISMAGTPHLSQAQKQQTAATPPTP